MLTNSGTFYALLSPSRFKLDGGAMFGIIPKPLWQKAIEADSLNRIEMEMRVWLIKQDNRVILVDTGIGDYHSEKFIKRFGINQNKSPLEKELEKFQISADQVTDIIAGHLHFDHIGGLSKIENNQTLPVFKNATLHLHQKHYEYSKNPTPRDAGSFHAQYFEPVVEYYKNKNRINWLNEDTGILIPSEKNPILYMTSHGHTPYQIHPFDSKFIFMGDLLPTANHIHLPWVMGYDIRPGVCSIEKQQFYKVIKEKELIMIFDHDMELWGASLKVDNEKYSIDKKYQYPIDINKL